MADGTIRPGLGGVMILISGLMALTTGLYSVLDPVRMIELYAEIQLFLSRDALLLLGGIQILFGGLAIAGGLMAMLKARMWGLATTGGILGTAAGGALFIGTIMGAIGLVLVASSRGQFRS